MILPNGGAIPSHPLDSNPLDVGFVHPPRFCLCSASSLTVNVYVNSMTAKGM